MLTKITCIAENQKINTKKLMYSSAFLGVIFPIIEITNYWNHVRKNYWQNQLARES